MLKNGNKTAVIGLQWGDEGKGKIVDLLSSDVDFVSRFQGGNNAGHTIIVGDKTYKLSLVPSGILHKNVTAFIGSGVVIDLEVLLAEVKMLQDAGVDIGSHNLKIADNATVILDIQKDLDKASSGKIGTTGRGIGFAYQDKVARRAVRICDLFDDEILLSRIKEICDFYHCHLKNVDPHQVFLKAKNFGLQIEKFVVPSVFLLQNRDKNILFEGAQGVLLDNSFGTYPFVTSSNTIASSLFCGTGLGISACERVIGALKAYTTRVGNGPFPTEDFGDFGITTQKVGKEFGTVTGRTRRCGHLDLVLAKYAADLCGVNEIAIMKLDVLSGFEKLKVCTSYKIDGRDFSYLPSSQVLQGKIEPQYQEVDGFSEEIYGITKYKDLPVGAKNYLAFIEDFLKVKITMISTGPKRDQIIFDKV